MLIPAGTPQHCWGHTGYLVLHCAAGPLGLGIGYCGLFPGSFREWPSSVGRVSGQKKESSEEKSSSQKKENRSKEKDNGEEDNGGEREELSSTGALAALCEEEKIIQQMMNGTYRG